MIFGGNSVQIVKTLNRNPNSNTSSNKTDFQISLSLFLVSKTIDSVKETFQEEFTQVKGEFTQVKGELVNGKSILHAFNVNIFSNER